MARPSTIACPEVGPNGQRCALTQGHVGAHQPWVVAPAQREGMTSAESLRLACGILAAIVFAYAGLQMVALRSQGGNSVAELFDNAVGIFSFGVALIAFGWSLPRR